MPGQLDWLIRLADAAPTLIQELQPRQYWSTRQRRSAETTRDVEWLARNTKSIIAGFMDEHYFAETIGFSCVDSNGEGRSSIRDELDRRVSKPELWTTPTDEWTQDDAFDLIEIFHDLAARPTRGWVHTYMGCGWHPIAFSRKSGQALYRWRMNEMLRLADVGYQLANQGEDIGALVRSVPGPLADLIDRSITSNDPDRGEVEHAVALFRSRDATRDTMRSAVVSLARILESRRDLLKAELLSKDEGALFNIANSFDVRHRNPTQHSDYGIEHLEWIFYWYLATIQLTEALSKRAS